MAEEKGFKTLDEQIGILRQHNIMVSNETSARIILEFDNYYCVVNGYKDPFLDRIADPKGDHYKSGTTLEEILGSVPIRSRFAKGSAATSPANRAPRGDNDRI